MRKALAAVATAALLAGGAVACSDSPRDRDCRPPGGRSGGSRSRSRSAPKPKPRPVYVPPVHVDGDDRC